MSKQEIYNQLRKGRLTREGALAMMGNWQCESGLEPNRLQGDFSPFRTSSKNYTGAVSTGAKSKESFAIDAKGYGSKSEDVLMVTIGGAAMSKLLILTIATIGFVIYVWYVDMCNRR